MRAARLCARERHSFPVWGSLGAAVSVSDPTIISTGYPEWVARRRDNIHPRAAKQNDICNCLRACGHRWLISQQAKARGRRDALLKARIRRRDDDDSSVISSRVGSALRLLLIKHARRTLCPARDWHIVCNRIYKYGVRAD